MSRALLAFFCCAAALSCCGDAEKLPVPPLPQDGTTLPYAQVLARLSAQTNTAKDAHFLNQWDAVVDASLNLEGSAAYVLKSPDLPQMHKAKIETAVRELNGDILKLRDAARKKDQTEALELIRRIHNQVRDLQDLK